MIELKRTAEMCVQRLCSQQGLGPISYRMHRQNCSSVSHWQTQIPKLGLFSPGPWNVEISFLQNSCKLGRPCGGMYVCCRHAVQTRPPHLTLDLPGPCHPDLGPPPLSTQTLPPNMTWSFHGCCIVTGRRTALGLYAKGRKTSGGVHLA